MKSSRNNCNDGLSVLVRRTLAGIAFCIIACTVAAGAQNISAHQEEKLYREINAGQDDIVWDLTGGTDLLEPTGLNRFRIKPQIPAQWNELSLQSCRILNRNLDFHISKEGNRMKVLVTDLGKQVWQGHLGYGKSIEIKL